MRRGYWIPTASLALLPALGAAPLAPLCPHHRWAGIHNARSQPLSPRGGLQTALTRVVRSILTLQYPVEGEVLKHSPLVDVLAQASLIAHANFLHHPPRCRIARHVGRMDPMQSKALEPIRHHGVRCLGAVARIPVGLPNPIAEFCMGVLLVEPQTNGTQEGVVNTANDCEIDEFT